MTTWVGGCLLWAGLGAITWLLLGRRRRTMIRLVVRRATRGFVRGAVVVPPATPTYESDEEAFPVKSD